MRSSILKNRPYRCWREKLKKKQPTGHTYTFVTSVLTMLAFGSLFSSRRLPFGNLSSYLVYHDKWRHFCIMFKKNHKIQRNRRIFLSRPTSSSINVIILIINIIVIVLIIVMRRHCKLGLNVAWMLTSHRHC